MFGVQNTAAKLYQDILAWKEFSTFQQTAHFKNHSIVEAILVLQHHNNLPYLNPLPSKVFGTVIMQSSFKTAECTSAFKLHAHFF